MKLADTGRQSRGALVAVALFLLFDSLALGLNFWLTARIEAQAIAINLAGRQRMLSQRMVKVLLQLRNATAHGEIPSASLHELETTFTLFDDTLTGFERGHLTRGGNDDSLFLPAVEGPVARSLVSEASELWKPYRALVAELLEGPPETLAQNLPAAVDYAERHNLQLLKLMNQLTTQLEQQTKHEASQIRYYQGAAFALALLNFFGAFAIYARRVRAAHKDRDLLDDIINRVAASVIVMDNDTRILKANRTTEQLFGYPPEALNGRPLSDILRGSEGNLIGQRRDGSTFLASASHALLDVGGRELLIDTIDDITQQRMNEERLTSLAYHDLLTRLPNRLLFEDRVRHELTHAQRRGEKLGVMFLDLDRFKPVNDTYGHETGDLLLREVARRLQATLRESDTVARRGGDEFTLLISHAENREALARVAKVIGDLLSTPFDINGEELQIGCSIGISLYPDDGNDAQTLLTHADEAMYRAKEAGRGTFCFYSEEKV